MPDLTNLQLIKRSRHVPASGDVFAMLLPKGTYLFGRVVLAEGLQGKGPMPCANLVYIYAPQFTEKDPDLERLTSHHLLIPPVWTNRLGWIKGIFQTVENHPLREHDLLRQHCFLDSFRGIYLDERGRKLPFRVDPCGEWGLVSYRWIDDHISDALGIPRVPESPDD
jgi:hypothetical protein